MAAAFRLGKSPVGALQLFEMAEDVSMTPSAVTAAEMRMRWSTVPGKFQQPGCDAFHDEHRDS